MAERHQNSPSSGTSSGYARSIDLPQVFRNLRNAKSFALDIGGSLAKVAYMSEIPRIRTRHYSFTGSDGQSESDTKLGTSAPPLYEVKEHEEIGLRLHFVKFETKYIDTCVDFITQNLMGELDKKLIKTTATGGGAYKFTEKLSKVGISVDKEDEMECLIKGCNFLLRNIPNEVFEYHRDKDPEYVFRTLDSSDIFPYLLVNIGSGVSILKVEDNNKFERVGGTSMGGGSFWGLGSLLTNAKGFDQLLELASEGNHRNVDMLVQDIYGRSYDTFGLPGDLTASSFGKTVRSSRDMPHNKDSQKFKDKDIAKSLLFMISNDIGQIASLHARVHGLDKIFFGGYFIRGHPVTMHTISFAINYWSKGKQQAMFLRHEGYLGAIGAFLKGTEDNVEVDWNNPSLYMWGENFARSSVFPGSKMKFPANNNGTMKSPHSPQNDVLSPVHCDVLELDRIENALVICPLLANPSDYEPDVHELSADTEARAYWLKYFEDNLDWIVAKVVENQKGVADAEHRAEQFRLKYQNRLSVLRRQPVAFGSLTVRGLLDTRDQFLNEFKFHDPFSQVKQHDNEAALVSLQDRLVELDAMEWAQRQVALVEGMLAGNMYDWASKDDAKLIEDSKLDFTTAKDKLQERPWLVDDLDMWIQRMKESAHKLAVLFVDNSGIDLILGVVPMVRELLNRGTKVILAANSYPSLTDVIHTELSCLMERVGEVCPELGVALLDGRLMIMENGTGSSCLDFRWIDAELAAQCQHADLIILEGMGRVIHTNFEARFTCESLKLAVIKDHWLAEHMGGGQHSVVFRYETGCPILLS